MKIKHSIIKGCEQASQLPKLFKPKPIGTPSDANKVRITLLLTWFHNLFSLSPPLINSFVTDFLTTLSDSDFAFATGWANSLPHQLHVFTVYLPDLASFRELTPAGQAAFFCEHYFRLHRLDPESFPRLSWMKL